MFCDSGLVFDDTEGVGSRFYVLRSRNPFWALPMAQGPVFKFCASGLVLGGTKGAGSSFALLDPFWAIPRASGLVFMFCSPGLIFGYRFHVWRFRTHFRLYRWRRVPFSCFALSGLFFAVPEALDSVFRLCAPRLVFYGSKGI
jgi:hypothetical protein